MHVKKIGKLKTETFLQEYFINSQIFPIQSIPPYALSCRGLHTQLQSS